MLKSRFLDDNADFFEAVLLAEHDWVLKSHQLYWHSPVNGGHGGDAPG